MITTLTLYLWSTMKNFDQTKTVSISLMYLTAFLGLLVDLAIIRILVKLI